MKKQIRRYCSALACLLIVTSKGFFAQVNPALAAQLQAILNNQVQNYGHKGVSACLIMQNGDTWKGVAGVGQNSVTITDSTVFHVASITKTSIASLILLLAQDQLLNLDAPWTNYVNVNANFNPSITVRQLINHTSGIKDYLEVPGSGTNVTSNFNYSYTPVEILENIVNDVPDFAPGTNFNYSSSNFVLAALIAQTVTGNPVAQELRNRIWSNWNMNNTYFGGFENYSEPRAGVWWDFGSGVQNYSSQPETSMLTYGFGAANLVSTPEDLARFARALFTGSILSQSSMTQMQMFSAPSYSSWCDGYGLGIHNALMWGNNSVLGHNGHYTNMADMFHSYDYGFTLVTMTNTQTQWQAIFNSMYNTIKNFLVTGVTENDVQGSVNLFPVPANDLLTIGVDGLGSNVDLKVTDISGKIIFQSKNNQGGKVNLDVSTFPEGLYALQVSGNGFSLSRKFSVSR